MAITRVNVEIEGSNSYDCRIGAHCSESIGDKLRLIPSLSECDHIMLITDSNVGPLYAPRVKVSLVTAGFKVDQITVPAGEKTKDLSTASEIWTAMSQLGMNRGSAVCALGGGVVGDLAGFVSATYMRGIPIVHIPTSLLAMVDSSIGGKTAINIPQGKNLVGAFHQPTAVFADTCFLDSLSSAELSCGLAEVAKTSLLSDDDYFFMLDDTFTDVCAIRDVLRKSEALQEIITRSVVIKSSIVAQDPRETADKRAFLNLGHTYGHALELSAGYGTYSHGACIAEGIRFAARVAEAELGASPEFTAAQDALLDKLGLPKLKYGIDVEKMLDAMLGDKKNGNSGIRFVLLRDLGKPTLHMLEPELVYAYLEIWKGM